MHLTILLTFCVTFVNMYLLSIFFDAFPIAPVFLLLTCSPQLLQDPSFSLFLIHLFSFFKVQIFL